MDAPAEQGAIPPAQPTLNWSKPLEIATLLFRESSESDAAPECALVMVVFAPPPAAPESERDAFSNPPLGSSMARHFVPFPRPRRIPHGHLLEAPFTDGHRSALARAELLVFTDPDIYPPPDWLERMVAAHERHGAVVVGARPLPFSRVHRHQRGDARRASRLPNAA